MIEAKFQTIQQFCEDKEKKRQDRNALCSAGMILVLMWSPLIFSLVAKSVRHQDDQGATIPAGGAAVWTFPSPNHISYGPDTAADPITSGPVYDSLSGAVLKWAAALGHPIKMPKLIRGDCGEQEIAIACAEKKGWRIQVQRVSKMWNTDAVMLHEVGHLLGVPHIAGDPLMDPVYQGEVSEPSPAAIVLAKLAEKRK